mgnify:CR=1 FL=1
MIRSLSLWLPVALAFLCTSLPLPAAALSLQDLHQRFTEAPNLRLSVTGTRYPAGFGLPLRGSGEMLVARDLGLALSSGFPLEIEGYYDGHEIHYRVGVFKPQVITSKDTGRRGRNLLYAALTRALLLADEAAMERLAQVNFRDMGDGSWQIELRPTHPELKKKIKRILADGGREISHIYIDEQKGAEIRIKLRNRTREPRELTPEERARFAPGLSR